MDNNIKSISAINPAIMENTEFSIIKECAPIINHKIEGVSNDYRWSIYASFPATSNAFDRIM